VKTDRIEKVHTIIKEMNIDACALKGMENIFYLTGFRGSEGTLIITKGDVLLLTDFRYITHAKEVTSGLQIIEVRQRESALLDICKKYNITKMGFDSFHITYNIYKAWQATLPGVTLIPLEHVVEEIRMIKEPDEITAIMKAIKIATEAFTEILEKIIPGRTEKEIANELDYAMRRLGADCPSFQTIVASGPRSALPHAEPSDKKIARGETIIIDFGAQVDGYCSDETYTVVTEEPDGKLQEIYAVVDNARKLALKTMKAGMSIKTVDTLVRGYIEEKGYGDLFRHGLGHGVGIAVHEAPAINSVSDGILEENMVLTVEPGIYLPNIGGVRLEDMVLITKENAQVLTHLRKEYKTAMGR
jgi:Xaa-Pro aminopeptidase